MAFCDEVVASTPVTDTPVTDTPVTTLPVSSPQAKPEAGSRGSVARLACTRLFG